MNTYVKLPARYYSLVASNPGSVLLQTSRYDAENHRSFLFFRPERTLASSSVLFDEIPDPRMSICPGTLDAPTGVREKNHIFAASKGDYYEIWGELPKHDTLK